jgi:hypothetical protein
MADHTKTITNTFQVFAPGPTSKWNSMVWGTDDWGGGDDQLASVHKFLASQDLSLSESWTKDASLANISNSLSVTNDITDITQVDSDGYYHMFKGNTSDAVDRISTDFSSVSDPSTSWSEQSDPSTDWS